MSSSIGCGLGIRFLRSHCLIFRHFMGFRECSAHRGGNKGKQRHYRPSRDDRRKPNCGRDDESQKQRLDRAPPPRTICASDRPGCFPQRQVEATVSPPLSRAPAVRRALWGRRWLKTAREAPIRDWPVVPPTLGRSHSRHSGQNFEALAGMRYQGSPRKCVLHQPQ